MKKLYRNSPSYIGGICNGLGEYFEVDDVIIRVIFTILIFTPFPIIILYILLWVSIPSKPKDHL